MDFWIFFRRFVAREVILHSVHARTRLANTQDHGDDAPAAGRPTGMPTGGRGGNIWAIRGVMAPMSDSTHPTPGPDQAGQSTLPGQAPQSESGSRPAGDAGAPNRTDAEWRERLTPAEFQVLRQAGTERPFTGEYWDTETEGVYACRACGSELFRSDAKFDAHCGWPSFFAPLAEDRVEYIRDSNLGMERIEVRCANCGSHMGHVFQGEGFNTPTDLRYCMNSVSLTLRPKDEA
jgi:peptide-methionine (R)-S-oxide reductase